MAQEARDFLVIAQSQYHVPKIVPGPLGCLILEPVTSGRAPGSQGQVSSAHWDSEAPLGATLFPLLGLSDRVSLVPVGRKAVQALKGCLLCSQSKGKHFTKMGWALTQAWASS